MIDVRSLALIVTCLQITFVPAACADDWPQWRGPHRDGVWRESGVITKFPARELKSVWRVPIGSGYSGPTVANGRVFVTDRVIEPEQIERVHCFDEKTGKDLWRHEYPCVYRDVGYDAGPRAAVLAEENRAYSLGTMGHLFCLDAATGRVIWKKDLNAIYKIRMPIWGIAASPIIEGDLLIVQVGGTDACIIAFDKKTGQERWKALDDNASYSAPIVIDQAGKRVLICWTGERVVCLDPANGKLHWAQPFEQRRMIINIPDPVFHDGYLFFTSFFDGSMLLRLEKDRLAAERVWRRMGEDEKNTDSLHSIISTPYLKDGYIYGVDSYGELRCLEMATGNRVWESLDAVPKARWATIHFVPNGENVWMFNERGELIISKLSPSGFTEIDRAKLIDPTTDQLRQRGGVCWSHPAFANRHVFARNDKELLCASLAAQ